MLVGGLEALKMLLLYLGMSRICVGDKVRELDKTWIHRGAKIS
jgi:hypothetical protein